MTVLQGGVQSLLQDAGRRGTYCIGITRGGPLDFEAYTYCNRLLQNDSNSCVIEISVGGLQLTSEVDTWLCLTGAAMPLLIDDEERENWCVHRVRAGDSIHIGHARSGCRGYLGVADGFDIPAQFGSASTVPRERLGGLNGSPLSTGDSLPCAAVAQRKALYLPANDQPRYQRSATLRVVPGYQHDQFTRTEKRRFFGAPYQVTERCDRMGYRLQGSPVVSAVDAMLSEGTGYGAIQIPPDGQPIVLLNDHQTIGGYPKIGTVLRRDASALAQLQAGATVHFAPVTPATARRVLSLEQRFALQKQLVER